MLHAGSVKRESTIVRGVWATCLLIAGLNHARLLVRHGLLWSYGGLHPVSAAYQTSLTVLDPVVAVSLFVRPKLGIVATIVLIVTNVIHNLATVAYHAPPGEFLTRASHPITASHVGFMLFVMATATVAWLRASAPSPV